VLQQLVRDGVLAGVRGPRGGYRLAKERKLITVGDIARVVAKLESGDEDNGDPGSVSEIGRKVVRPLCRELRAETFERLDAITVEALCRRARGEGVPSEAARRLDYSI
jgi:DNA-binding IscR family transcriptional regulator